MGKKTLAIISVVIILIIGVIFASLMFSNNGNLALKVADQPMPGISAVYITFTEVALHGNQSGWTYYNLSSPVTINILGLTINNASLLTNISLSAQKYTMMRLYISSVTVNIVGMGNISFKLSSPFAFINHPINIPAHKTVTVIIDFSIQQSLNLQSRMFTPYIGNFIVQG
jgi:hypothetical protein